MFNRKSPARDVAELLEYLAASDDSTSFLYRGQRREYPGPLLPALYRTYGLTGKTYSGSDEQFKSSIRKAGRLYWELEPVAGWMGVSTASFDSAIANSPFSKEALLSLYCDPQTDINAASGRIADALCESFPKQSLTTIEAVAPWLTDMMNVLHQRYIRDMVFSLPLGRLLGSVVAQQYGFTSGFLDVTTSPVVAAFFASFEPPKYLNARSDSEPGIIYRFPTDKMNAPNTSWAMTRCSPSFPSAVAVADLVAPFESTDLDYARGLQCYVEYALDALETGDPLWEAFALPSGWLEFSRMGRQQSAVLIPDRIVEPILDEFEPVSLGQPSKIAHLFAVEDLSSRVGVEKYYFFHRSEIGESLELTREYLWPRDADFFLMVTKSLLMLGPPVAQFPRTGYPHSHVPRRPDLVNSGYTES